MAPWEVVHLRLQPRRPGTAYRILMAPYVTVSDHFQIAPEDRDVPAIIRVTSTVSVTTVNCTVTMKYIFALLSR